MPYLRTRYKYNITNNYHTGRLNSALVLVQLQSDRKSTIWSESSGRASAKTTVSNDDASSCVASYHLPSRLQEGAGMLPVRAGPEGPAGPQVPGGYPSGTSQDQPHLFGSAVDIPEYHSLKGAELHSVGQCKPCAWFWGKKGCANGMDCAF